MPDHRQKKLARHKKKRASVQRSHGQPSGSLDDARSQLMHRIVREAPDYSPGPCFIASTWRDQSTSRVIPVAITRRPVPGHLVMVIYLVDLGCFGLKDAILTLPFEEARIDEILQNLANSAQASLSTVPIEVASTVIRKAIAWGAKLGFEPSAEDSELLSFLVAGDVDDLDVPLGRDGKVLYEPDPEEDTRPIVQKLVQQVGPDGFTVVMPRKPTPDAEAQDP